VSGPPRSEARGAGGRRLQARGAATRRRLLASAEELFTRHGFDGTSIGDVARRAGVGVGTVYHHFADKRALLLELIDAWAGRLQAEQEAAPLERFYERDVREAFHRWLAGAYRRLRRQPSLYVVALAMAGRDPEVAARWRRVEALAAGRMRALLELGRRRGHLRADLDVEAAAVLASHAVDVVATRLLVRGEAEPAPERVVAGLADMLSRYVLPPGGRDVTVPPSEDT